VDGFDTVALQGKHPELFNVTDKDGVPKWTLRPEVLATLRSAYSLRNARRRLA
jgi:hypothetical protein